MTQKIDAVDTGRPDAQNPRETLFESNSFDISMKQDKRLSSVSNDRKACFDGPKVSTRAKREPNLV